ncbi:MAG TPA: nucleotide exchange factor GrpE [Thermoleophilia bacterium]|nr:nucleotide exchange factor GrpE [Thermoleophilia bacterium]
MTHEKRKIPINHRDPNNHEPEGGADPAVETTVGEGAARISAAEAGQADVTSDEVTSPLVALAAERDGYLDALMRLQAEFENFRRRSQRELGEARNRARTGVLGEFLPVFDNLSRALDAAEHHEEGKVLEGVRLTHSLFADLLRREGVCEIPSLGVPFDPHLHEAVVSLPSDVEEGVVIQVVAKGYTVGESVLRPARVAVSAGVPGGEASASGASTSSAPTPGAEKE